MTNTEKQLLLKDLCARLPYGVIIKNKYSHIRYNFNSLVKDEDGEYLIDGVARLDEIEIYLRPMSSMTDDEKKEYEDCFIVRERDGYNNQDKPIYTGEELVYVDDIKECIDWLNAHHFDYRGLIPMGLALDAPEGMYKNE